MPIKNFNSPYIKKEKLKIFKDVHSNTNYTEFKKMVNKAKRYIF